MPDVNIKAEATSASVTNLIQVAKKESEVAFAQGDAAASAVQGTGTFAKKLPVVMLGKLYPNLLHLVTLKNAGINSVQDIRGRRISVGAPGSGNAVSTWNVLRALGITDEDFTVRQLNYAETSSGLKDGTIDAGFISGAIGTAAIVELAVSREIVLVPFSDDEMTKITASMPSYTALLVPPQVYKGIDEPVQTPSLWNMLTVHKDMDEDLAYRLLKTMFEHKKELETISKVAKFITVESSRDTGTLPLHPGARRYYDETFVQP